MNYKQAIEWVHGLGRMPAKPGLARMQALMHKLGDPQDKLKYLHVAGTNGKGSTVTMAASVLKQAGYKVGANISPYVLNFRERFQINGEMISEEDLATALTQVCDAAKTLPEPVIEFEAVTAAAFVHFAKAGCDIVCMEVGLGGRLDATNIIKNTLVACILHIGYDHTEVLGNNLTTIAAEKCGILKNGCTVISYPAQPPAAAAEIARQAKWNKCQLVVPELEDFYFYKGRPFENHIDYGGYDLHLPFAGRHQAYNAAVVVQAMLALCKQGFSISDEAIMQGIEQATFPARIEILSRSPLIILDGAHNEDSAVALADTLQREGAKGMVAVMGALKDKDARQMLHLLAPFLSAVYTVQLDNPRSLTASQLAELAKEVVPNSSGQPNVQAALERAKKQPSGGVLVCGSLYLAAEARRLLC